MCSLLLENSSLLDGVRGLGDVLTEEVTLPEVGDADVDLVAEEVLGGDIEDLCILVSDVHIVKGPSGNLRSSSSRVSCFVSRRKQKTIPQAMRLRPA